VCLKGGELFPIDYGLSSYSYGQNIGDVGAFVILLIKRFKLVFIQIVSFFTFSKYLLVILTSMPAWAQVSISTERAVYPNKAIRLIVPLAPGGGGDIMARAIGQRLTDNFRQSVIVDNRAGGATMIGTEIVARAPADGYTLVMATSSHAINPSLYPRLPFDPIKDFSAVTLIATSPLLLVLNPSLPAKTVKEFVALAQSRTAKLNFASGGPAGIPHLAAELFKMMAHVDLVHIPYKGMGLALTDLIGAQVDLLFSTPVASLPYVKSGRLRGIAGTGAVRSLAFPDIPTIAEAGYPGYEAGTWYALLAPAGTPRQAINRLNAEVLKIIQVPDLRERLADLGVEFVGSTPEACIESIKSELRKWSLVIKQSNIRAD
jgi:tripartite-type tricarboxylate transporter receptor subunit TctC